MVIHNIRNIIQLFLLVLTYQEHCNSGPSPYLPFQLSATKAISNEYPCINKIEKLTQFKLEKLHMYLKLDKLIEVSLVDVVVL